MPAANDPENDGAWFISRPIAVTLNDRVVNHFPMPGGGRRLSPDASEFSQLKTLERARPVAPALEHGFGSIWNEAVGG